MAMIPCCYYCPWKCLEQPSTGDADTRMISRDNVGFTFLAAGCKMRNTNILDLSDLPHRVKCRNSPGAAVDPNGSRRRSCVAVSRCHGGAVRAAGGSAAAGGWRRVARSRC